MWLEIGLTTGGVAAFFIGLMNCDIDYATENKCLDLVECHCCCFEQTVPDDDDLSSKSCDSQEKPLNDNERTGNLDDFPLLDEGKEGDISANLPFDVPSAIVCEANIQADPTMITLSSQAIVEPTRSDNPLHVQVNGVEAPVEEQSSTAKSINHHPPETRDPRAVDSKTSSRSSIKDGQQKPVRQDSWVKSLASSKSSNAERHFTNEQETRKTDSVEMEACRFDIQEQVAMSQAMPSRTGSNEIDEQGSMQGAEKMISETETCNTTVSSNQKMDDVSVPRASNPSIAKTSDSNQSIAKISIAKISFSKDRNQSIAKEEASCTNVIGQIRAASIDDSEQFRLNSPRTWATFDSSKLMFPPAYKGPRHSRTSHYSSLIDDNSVEVSCKDDFSADTRSVSIYGRNEAGSGGSTKE
jgi:hypothetical protein